MCTKDTPPSPCYYGGMEDTTTSVGNLGEAVAIDFLQARGYEVIKTNFRRPYGELDIIAKQEQLVFVEVKSMRCRIPDELPRDGADDYRPEENVGDQKRERLRRIIQTYLSLHPAESWRVDLLCVYLDEAAEAARVKQIKNIIV